MNAKNDHDWTISSQASKQLDEGSETNVSSLVINIPFSQDQSISSAGQQAECRVCGRKMVTITNTHLKHRHSLTKKEYLCQFPDASLGTCSWLASWRNSEANKEHLKAQSLRVINDHELITKRNDNRNVVMNSESYKNNLSNAMKAYAQTPEGKTKFANRTITARMRLSNFERWQQDYGYAVAVEKQLEWQKRNILRPTSRYTKIELKTAEALRDAGYDIVTQFSVPHYYCDIYVPTLNLIVEVNGDYWHANPKFHNSDDVIGHKRMLASQIWECDARKMKALEAMGYNVVVVWEHKVKQSTHMQLVEDIVRSCKKLHE